ncbi:MAG: MFS transporter [Defluviitaleaceae bacterium]|nr:MFS transporter [Defluviitaleaceae bacterium]
MFKFLLALRGNARACVLTEPLYGIPFNLYVPFVTLYMYHLGVMDREIGLLLSIGRLIQVVMSLTAGIITDKFGRRLTTLIGDIVSWSVPTLIWAFSQNFWWFLAAAIINSLWQITAVSWECLWVDDTDEKDVAPIFNWIYITGLLAVFFAPIAGYFVHIYGVVPVVRVLYVLAFIFMTTKFIVLYIYSTETKRGTERMAAVKNVPVMQSILGYKAVFLQIIRSRLMTKALILQAIWGVVFLVSGTFFALYATQNLSVPESFLAYFPILRAAIMLLFLLVIQERLSKYKSQYMMVAGLVLYIISMGWLLATPQYDWLWLAVYIAMDACAAALLLPRLDALVVNAIDPLERARIRSLFSAIILAISSPFGYLAGLLSDMDRRFPFMLNIFLLVIMVFVLLANKKPKPAVA